MSISFRLAHLIKPHHVKSINIIKLLDVFAMTTKFIIKLHIRWEKTLEITRTHLFAISHDNFIHMCRRLASRTQLASPTARIIALEDAKVWQNCSAVNVSDHHLNFSWSHLKGLLLVRSAYLNEVEQVKEQIFDCWAIAKIFSTSWEVGICVNLHEVWIEVGIENKVKGEEFKIGKVKIVTGDELQKLLKNKSSRGIKISLHAQKSTSPSQHQSF